MKISSCCKTKDGQAIVVESEVSFSAMRLKLIDVAELGFESSTLTTSLLQVGK